MKKLKHMKRGHKILIGLLIFIIVLGLTWRIFGDDIIKKINDMKKERDEKIRQSKVDAYCNGTLSTEWTATAIKHVGHNDFSNEDFVYYDWLFETDGGMQAQYYFWQEYTQRSCLANGTCYYRYGDLLNSFVQFPPIGITSVEMMNDIWWMNDDIVNKYTNDFYIKGTDTITPGSTRGHVMTFELYKEKFYTSEDAMNNGLFCGKNLTDYLIGACLGYRYERLKYNILCE